MLHTGIILQVRTGSTRFPKKMVQPFYKGKSILEILIERYLGISKNEIPMVIATTIKSQDDVIEDVAKRYNVNCFRGSEENVLQRFLDTADHFGFGTIIRVCGDNPFFDFESTLALLSSQNSNKYDYISYKVDQGKPSILSHLGFWGEIVKYDTLKRIISSTNKKIYLEHVTNYIYLHPEKFSIKLINAPDGLGKRDDIRLTVDTKIDFEMNQMLYQQIVGQDISFAPKKIVNYIDQHIELKKIMTDQIKINSK